MQKWPDCDGGKHSSFFGFHSQGVVAYFKEHKACFSKNEERLLTGNVFAMRVIHF